MGFVKVVKNKAYFKRFQTKFRRRRECVTDYYARKRLIIQDKNKYKSPKYRMVFRRTNRDIIMQIVAADMTNDRVIASAYSHELPAFGVKAGLTNYAAAYCTGLLLARRVNAEMKLPYEGVTEPDGAHWNIMIEEYEEENEDGKSNRRPFKAVLDVGLQRTTRGARIFGGLKGACDGGINVPHSDKNFPRPEGADEPDADRHREYIFGQHVANYMRMMAEEDADKYNTHFSSYIAAGVDADGLEDMYTAAHAAIRADPSSKRQPSDKGYFPGKKMKKARTGPRGDAAAYKDVKHKGKKRRTNLAQRKGRIKAKLLAAGIVSIPKLVLRK